MTELELASVNETILIMAHDLAIRDLNEAVMVFNVTRDVAIALSETPIRKLRAAAVGAKVLIHPGMLPAETWLKLRDMDDDAASALSIIANIQNS